MYIDWQGTGRLNPRLRHTADTEGDRVKDLQVGQHRGSQGRARGHGAVAQSDARGIVQRQNGRRTQGHRLVSFLLANLWVTQ